MIKLMEGHMRRKIGLFSLVIIVSIILSGCPASIQITPARIYLEAQTTYINAWDSYHTVWVAFPKNDPRKTEWVKKYHPKFREAGRILKDYQVNSTDSNRELLDKALDECENILITLAISKIGGQQ